MLRLESNLPKALRPGPRRTSPRVGSLFSTGGVFSASTAGSFKKPIHTPVRIWFSKAISLSFYLPPFLFLSSLITRLDGKETQMTKTLTLPSRNLQFRSMCFL